MKEDVSKKKILEFEMEKLKSKLLEKQSWFNLD